MKPILFVATFLLSLSLTAEDSLYNIIEDPLEMKDLAHDPKQEKRIATLYGRLLKLQKEMDDKVDLKVAFPNL